MASSNTRRKQSSEIEDNELYNTPDIALETFYEQYPEVFDSYNKFYDPCNGIGKISNFLKGIGKECLTSDLVDYRCQDFVQDFLTLEELPEGVDCVIMNPPFTLTEKFIDKFYELTENKTYVSLVMFNRMTTIESNSRSRKFQSGKWNLMGMYQFGFRVSCTKGINEEPTANSVAYSWFELVNIGVPINTELYWVTK